MQGLAVPVPPSEVSGRLWPLQASERSLLLGVLRYSDHSVGCGVKRRVPLPDCLFNDTFRWHMRGAALSIPRAVSLPAPDSLPSYSLTPEPSSVRQLARRAVQVRQL